MWHWSGNCKRGPRNEGGMGFKGAIGGGLCTRDNKKNDIPVLCAETIQIVQVQCGIARGEGTRE